MLQVREGVLAGDAPHHGPAHVHPLLRAHDPRQPRQHLHHDVGRLTLAVLLVTLLHFVLLTLVSMYPLCYSSCRTIEYGQLTTK